MLCKKGDLKNFAIFTGKRPVLESLLNEVAGLQTGNFIKKTLQDRCFLVKYLQTTASVVFFFVVLCSLFTSQIYQPKIKCEDKGLHFYKIKNKDRWK